MPAPPTDKARIREVFPAAEKDSPGLLGNYFDWLGRGGVSQYLGMQPWWKQSPEDVALGLTGGGVGALRQIPSWMKVIKGGAPRTMEHAFAREVAKGRTATDIAVRHERLARGEYIGTSDLALRAKGYRLDINRAGEQGRAGTSVYIYDKDGLLKSIIRQEGGKGGKWTGAGAGIDGKAFNSFEDIMSALNRELPNLRK